MKNIIFVLKAKGQPNKLYLDSQVEKAFKDFHTVECQNLEPILFVHDLVTKANKHLLGRVDLFKQAKNILKSYEV